MGSESNMGISGSCDGRRPERILLGAWKTTGAFAQEEIDRKRSLDTGLTAPIARIFMAKAGYSLDLAADQRSPRDQPFVGGLGTK